MYTFTFPSLLLEVNKSFSASIVTELPLSSEHDVKNTIVNNKLKNVFEMSGYEVC